MSKGTDHKELSLPNGREKRMAGMVGMGPKTMLEIS